jgi:3'-phosphoadenosine 5'-phosphosulfate synthase
VARDTEARGVLGRATFYLKHRQYDSFWHDVPIRPSGQSGNIVNFVVEIPMYMTAKMEVQKELSNNVIKQDTNKDGSSRYYTYGTPFLITVSSLKPGRIHQIHPPMVMEVTMILLT